MNNSAYLTPNELSSRWKFHRESIRRMIREGRIQAYRFGRRLRVKMEDIERLESEGRIVPHAELTTGGSA